MKFPFPAITACAALVGCHPPTTSVEADWSGAIARLDYIAIYPITEDLQPGDILLSIPSKGGQPQPTVQRLGSLSKEEILRALMEQEESRIVMQGKTKTNADAGQPGPKPASGTNVTLTAAYTGAANVSTQVRVDPVSTAKPAPPDKKKPAEAADKPAKLEVIAPDATQLDGKLLPRFRRVAVPLVAAARVYQGDIGAGGSSGSLGLGAVLGLRGDVAVSIYLKELEALGVDSLRALRVLERTRREWLMGNALSAPRLLAIASRADPGLGDRLCRGDPPPRGERRALIQVVNQVLYAHSIQFEYQQGSSFAAKLALDFAKSVSAAQGTVPTLKAGAVAASTGTPGTPPTADTASADAAAQLLALSNSLTLPSSPGVRTSLGIGSSGEVALTDTFDQPMAVGFSTVSSYSVRGSLLFVAASPGKARDQAIQLDTMCRPRALGTPENGGLSPIQRLVCSNTAAFNKGDEVPLPMPDLCYISDATRTKLRPDVDRKLRPDVDSLPSEAMTEITY